MLFYLSYPFSRCQPTPRPVRTPTAHPCHLCGRRFSISSNLRRHLRSCPVAKGGVGELDLDIHIPSEEFRSPGRRRRETKHNNNQPWIPLSLVPFKNASILTSNLAIARFHMPKTTITIPLQPVIPHGSISSASDDKSPAWEHLRTNGILPERKWEERDSYDESAPIFPYHPVSWTGRLPGPGLMKVDELVRQVMRETGQLD